MNTPESNPPSTAARRVSKPMVWSLFTPIREITEDNSNAVIEWLVDRSSVLIWFTSIVTGSLVVLTVFGKKPGFDSIGEVSLSISLLLVFISILCNLICVWQIPKWKFAIRTGLISDGKKMTLDLEITSWLGLISFLAALVLAAFGNSI